jgi:hypothetical protein
MLPFEDYYFLLHAFDRIGRRLYPEWTGDEFDQRSIPSPEVIASEREPLEKRLPEIGAELDAVAAEIRGSLKESEIAEYKGREAQLFEERNSILDRLRHTWRLDDESYRREFAAYERQLKTKEVLFAALEARQIQVQLGRSLIVDWPAWRIEPGFRCNLALSLVRVPRFRSSMRRSTALIRRDEFDKWLNETVPENRPGPEETDPATRCEVWLLDLIRESKGKQPDNRRRIYEAAHRAIPKLTERQFLRAWARVAPPEWKKGGRRPAPNRSGI